jgi:phosphosulfolactate phosphohydrolase-like enzyme
MGPRERREVVIDALAGGVYRHLDSAIVCIDVLLSTSTLVTAVAGGRRAVPVASLESGHSRVSGLRDAVLSNESDAPIPVLGTGGLGPAALEGRGDRRPLVLVSSAAELIENAAGAKGVYIACLRNLSATVDALAAMHSRIALVGAGHGSDTRCEDQLAAAWMARQLVAMGYEPAGHQTVREMERWSHADLSVVRLGRGAEHWRRQGHAEDVDFVLDRVDDLDLVCVYDEGEVRAATFPASPSWITPARVAAAASH